MNQRLEQEIKMILSQAINEQFGDGRVTSIRDCFTRDELVSLILAGYNLALEDVRKEIERRLVDLNTRPYRYVNAMASIWSLKSLASFIDDQKSK